MKPHRLLTVALLSLSLITPLAFAQELLQGDKDHADHDKKEQPKKPQAKVSPDARTLLDQLSAAYKKLNSLNVSGTLTADIDVGGESSRETSAFEASFQAPNKFKHEIKDARGRTDLVLGSTGEKLYAFRPRHNDYKQAAAPKERAAFDRIPNPMRDLLQMQNPSLMAALCDDASKFLLDGVTEVAKVPDTDIAGAKLPTLEFKSEHGDYRVALDPQTKLIRRIDFDMVKTFTKHRDDVKKYLLTYDYTHSSPVANPAPEAFAWAVPDDAREAVTAAPEVGENAEKALTGKPAPDFSLKGMDGKPVALADLQGNVIILDFWATWCGPCRASLPGLNKLHKELKEKGLQTFAVDLEESKDVVQPVAAKICPDIPVLFDEDSKVAKSYGVSGIPQTVVIGKDGKIRKIIIGGGNEARIRAAAEAALKE
jgi:peroxiredoxin